MKKMTVRNVLAIFISVAMVHALAGPALVGVATAKGSFRVDDSYVAGNATLFDGARVETGVATGELNLSKAKVTLDSGTRTRVYQDRVVLDQGKVQWNGSALRMRAGLWDVIGADGASKAVVVRHGESFVVGALAGSVMVLDGSGALVRTIGTGLAFSFTQDQAPGATSAANKDKDCDSKDKSDKDYKDKKHKKDKGCAVAAGAAGAAGVGGAAVGGGMAAGTIAVIGVAAAAAVAIPIAVVATRDNSSSASR